MVASKSLASGRKDGFGAFLIVAVACNELLRVRTSPFWGEGGKVCNGRLPVVNRAIDECTGLPLNGHCRRCLNNRAVGCGKLVIRFGVPEGKSEVSYLSQFHLLNATGRVYLNL